MLWVQSFLVSFHTRSIGFNSGLLDGEELKGQGTAMLFEERVKNKGMMVF